jgi:predicted membrane chloride channel (bestrophin family)
VPPFLLACFFLFGVKLIETVVEEPFGRERDELDRHCRTIRDGVGDSVPLTPDLPGPGL